MVSGNLVPSCHYFAPIVSKTNTETISPDESNDEKLPSEVDSLERTIQRSIEEGIIL